MKLAFLDIETTGLNPYANEVLEVAYVREDEDSCVEGTTHFSLPITHKRAEPEALKINKYFQREDELRAIQIKPMMAVAKLVTELEGYMIVGANPAFDTAFLRHFLWTKAQLEPTWYYRVLDLNALGSGVLGSTAVLKTPYIAEKFNAPLGPDQHTALADAKWNREVYHAIKNAL